MKTKQFIKKLSLNKSTIADLNQNEMKVVFAGYDQTHWTFCDCNTRISCFYHCETDICPIPITTVNETCDTELEC